MNEEKSFNPNETLNVSQSIFNLSHLNSSYRAIIVSIRMVCAVHRTKRWPATGARDRNIALNLIQKMIAILVVISLMKRILKITRMRSS